MKNILLATDNGEHGQKLIDFATEIALKFKAKLWLVHTVEMDSPITSLDAASIYERDYHAAALREQHKKIQATAAAVKAQGIDSESLMISGPTVETILEKARELNAGMIICGLNEHGWLYKAFLGHTAVQLIRQTDIPVLTVPLAS